MERSGIQFVSSADGTSIAYRSVGSGPPIIVLHNWTVSHAELEWELSSLRSFYEALGEHREVIRLDPRGAGLSDALEGDDPLGFIEDVAGDVEAVADAMGHAQFDLIASFTAAPVGILLATRGRVGRLVLCDPVVDFAEAKEFMRFLRAIESSAKVDATFGAEMIVRIWGSTIPPEDRDAFAAVVDTNLRNHPAQLTVRETHASHWLGQVVAPTLIVYNKGRVTTSMEQARQAAATIPDARLVGVDGSLAPYWVDREAMLAALGDFLDWESGTEQIASDFSVIVFTDIVASTEVVDRLGDEAARSAVRTVEGLVADATAGLSGKVVKHLGDGSLLEFRSASNALDFARKIQAELADGDIGLRVGMAAGEPIHEDGDVHGAVVVVASRIADSAGTGEIFVSDGVRQLVVGKQYDFQDRGEQTIKGFDEPVRVWRLAS